MSASSRETVSDVVLAEFNAWMAGVAEYHELSPAGRAYCDEYLEEYWQYVDALCAAADA
ncbi:MAG TPA: hypothetical protein VIK75_11060 [Calditerricola sp.]